MRHRIIHEYFAVQTDTVWDVVRADIPVLRERIRAILATLPEGGF
jgi:uncharacterized protein with HEPN domain